jgi:hypothetical protein
MNIEHMLDAFESAVYDKAFEGTIPAWSPDREEQKLIDAARRRIKTNYTKARNRLLKALEASQPVFGECNPEPMSAEEEAYHRKQGTIT